MKKRVECSITGRVQMVMFRDFVTRKARSLKLVGCVENKKDGSVFVIAEGDHAVLKFFVEKLKKGSILSKVQEVKADFMEPRDEFSRFEIKY